MGLYQSPPAEHQCSLFSYSTFNSCFLCYCTAPLKYCTKPCFWVCKFWLENIHPSDLWGLCIAASITLFAVWAKWAESLRASAKLEAFHSVLSWFGKYDPVLSEDWFGKKSLLSTVSNLLDVLTYSLFHKSLGCDFWLFFFLF